MMDESAYESAEGGSGFGKKNMEKQNSRAQFQHKNIVILGSCKKLFEVVFWQPKMLICMEAFLCM